MLSVYVHYVHVFCRRMLRRTRTKKHFQFAIFAPCCFPSFLVFLAATRRGEERGGGGGGGREVKNLNPAPEREEEKVPDSIGENRAAIDPMPAQHRNLSRLHAGKEHKGGELNCQRQKLHFGKGKNP